MSNDIVKAIWYLTATFLLTPFICPKVLAAEEQSTVASNGCGDVSIARMNWASAVLIAEVDKFILSVGYGCNTSLVDGDTLPTLTTMRESGQPDLAPEIWVDAAGATLDQAVASGRLEYAAKVMSDGGDEGWWMPAYIAQAHPDIKTVADALEHPELFPSPVNESRGAIYNCPESWNCQVPTSNLFRAFGAEEKGFELIATDSSAALDASIINAFEREQGWLGYYWSPNAILGLYEMVKLDMGEQDKDEWLSCTSVPDCADPAINSWSRSEAYSIVSRDFAQKSSAVMDYLNKRTWDSRTVNWLLAWMLETQASAEEAARYFLLNHQDIWTSWIPESMVSRVKNSL